MNCRTCGVEAAPGLNICDKGWACDVRANTLLCETCAHPFWAHGAEHDGRCYSDKACKCTKWVPGPKATALCMACGGALGPNEKERHADREWCKEWEFWIECGNCRHPWDAHDLESGSCLGIDDLCKCTKWRPVPRLSFDSPAEETVADIPEEDLEELEDTGS